MNMNDYRRAMDRVVPDPALKERIMNKKTKKHIPARRAAGYLLAAALALVCLFTVALAASPELRTAVLSLFHMEEREQVPGGDQNGSQSTPGVSHADIGELVKAQYIRLDSFQTRYCGGGLFSDQTWSEDHRTLLDAKFWEAQNNELLPVQVNMQTSQVDITYKSFHYQGEIYWFVREGELYTFAGDTRCYDEERELEYGWYFSDLPGRTDAILLRLSQGRQMDYTEYPFLYHLDTGELEDILASTGVDRLENVYNYDWSENFRRAIILTGNHLDDQQSWICDLDAKTLSNLNDLAKPDDADSCTAAFADNDTLILHAMTRTEDGNFDAVAFYTYDLRTGSMAKILDKTPYYRSWDENPSGVMSFGSRCLLVSEEGQVRAIDMKTGAQTILDGFTFHKEDRLNFNPSGSKLLYFAMDPNTNGLGISQIGVADLEKGAFFAFDRDGYENLYEGSIGWEDDNTVGISAHTPDYETRYMLLYRF